MSLFDGKEWKSWTHADGLGGPNPDGRPPSRNTGLGTRSRHDLGMLSGGQATYNPSYVFCLLADDQDRVWAGTWGGGVARFDGKGWTNFTRKDGLAGDIVYSMLQGRNGVMWFGTNKGISRFDGKSWQTFDFHHGLPDLNIYALAEAPNEDIWAGTRSAVVRLGVKREL